MGTDIHLFVEHKVNKWKKVALPSIYAVNNRNYMLFGALAGARSSVVPISKPKGLPIDLSNDIRAEFKTWEGNAHNASYFTLTDLLKYRDGIAIVHDEIIYANEYKSFKKTGEFNVISRRCRLDDKCISNEEMDRMIELLAFWDCNYYTRVDRKIPYREISENFWVHLINDMQKLDSNTDNVRTIFWFDN